VRLPSLWRIEPESGAAAGDAVSHGSQEITACVVPMAAGSGADAAGDGRVSRQVLQARAGGSMTIAAFAPGNLVLDDNMLQIKPFNMAQSRKLWDGIMVQPLAQSSWEDVRATLKAIADAGYRPVVRLTREAITALVASGITLPADYYLLDLTRADIPAALWTPFAHRHNRNDFLYATSGQGVLYTAGGD